MLPDLTVDDAVELLVARHQVAGQIKQALATPFGEINIPDLSPHIQRIMTPGADDQLGQAAHSGLIGAGVGGAVGLGSSMFSNRRKHWLRNALTGAMLGGVGGAAFPTGLRHWQSAVASPPSVQTHEAEKAKQQAGLEQAAPANNMGRHFVAGMQLPPAEARELALGRSDANQNWDAGATVGGMAPRIAGESAVGYGTGRILDKVYREATLGSRVPGMVQEKKIGQQGLKPEVVEAVGAGATPRRVGDIPGNISQPSRKQWSALRSQARGLTPRGKTLPRVLGGAGALLPLIEAATGHKVDPVGWAQRAFSGGK